MAEGVPMRARSLHRTSLSAVIVFQFVAAAAFSVAAAVASCSGSDQILGRSSSNGSGAGGSLGIGAGTNSSSSGPFADGGTDGGCASCPVGQLCSNGACVCPTYQTLCDGGCIPTSDPDNCGGCGAACSPSQVCSSGACVSADAGCLSGLVPCDRACVDPNDDNGNCGGCGASCGSGTGCAGGKCVPSLAENDAGPGGCVGGGPPIDVGADAGCAGNLGQVAFTWALCSCTNLDISAPLTTDAYNSMVGPPDGGLGASVGCDDAIVNWSSSVSIGGDLWAADAGTFMPSGPGSVVRHDLQLGGSINASSPFTVDHDAYVVGTVSGVTVQGTVSHPASIAAPCGCAPSQLVPVAAIVAAHTPPNNDDALLGLDPSVVAAGGGPLRIDLPCGNYYFTSISTSNPLTIFAHGHTAIYVDGDVTAGAPLAFQLDPTATLDIFISGTITTSQLLTIGSPNYPALCRAYVGGTATLAFSQSANIGCNLYAAESTLVDWSATSAIYGSIFAGDFKASHNTTIHYDLGILSAGTACGGGGGLPDGGSGPPGCSSCRDCGNQACNNGQCGPCTTSADCCAPLECQNGTCVTMIQ
jgi:hypothetical protein